MPRPDAPAAKSFDVRLVAAASHECVYVEGNQQPPCPEEWPGEPWKWCGACLAKAVTASCMTADGHGTTLPSPKRLSWGCDRAASRSLRNVEHFIRNGNLEDAQREVRRVIYMVERIENDRGVHCECSQSDSRALPLEDVSPSGRADA